MNYFELNQAAFSGTAANLVKLLKAFGDDSEAVAAMQKGVKGLQLRERGWKKLWDGYGYYLKPYKTEVAERAVKNDVMADFYAKQGVFAPTFSKELSDKFNEQAKQIEELKKTVAEQAKTIETLKKNPPEHPSIH